MAAMAVLAIAAIASLVAGAPPSRCRCTPGQACWERVPWAELNESVGGRLQASVDEMEACLKDVSSSQCAQALVNSDNEFWLSGRPNGYQHTGLYGAWNISTRLSAYSVLAETEGDVTAAVAFAHKHNLRLVVKATGHDWYGRSSAPGSLLIWTHLRKKITWHDTFVPKAAPPSTAPVPAVTVESGVQFMDLYPAAMAHPFPNDPYGRRSIVMGGTCDSVGVGGCWLAGCFGPFTKRFGSGSVNMLEARVVLANGTAVTANAHTAPDLYWTLRGGGGGNTAVVTDFTARVHPSPRWFRSGTFSASAPTAAAFKPLVVAFLRAAADAMADGDSCGDGGIGFGGGSRTGYTVHIGCNGYEANATDQAALFDGLARYVKEHSADGVKGGYSSSYWHQDEYNASAPSFPWMELHPDREISTELVGSLTKYLPIRGIRTPSGPDSVESMADGIIEITDLAQSTNAYMLNFVMFAKAQSAMPEEIVARFNETSQNPVQLDALGLWLLYLAVPSLPQLPPSATLLKTMWPRLQRYAVLSQSDPMWAPCSAGAAGDEAKATECFSMWDARLPSLTGKIEQMRRTLWQTFPNTGSDGKPYSGSYWCETDYDDLDFRASHWGTNYPRLLELKRRFDPDGLFYGHHAVGSELWMQDGNCRVGR